MNPLLVNIIIMIILNLLVFSVSVPHGNVFVAVALPNQSWSDERCNKCEEEFGCPHQQHRLTDEHSYMPTELSTNFPPSMNVEVIVYTVFYDTTHMPHIVLFGTL